MGWLHVCRFPDRLTDTRAALAAMRNPPLEWGNPSITLIGFILLVV